jgi:hypothetical protein
VSRLRAASALAIAAALGAAFLTAPSPPAGQKSPPVSGLQSLKVLSRGKTQVARGFFDGDTPLGAGVCDPPPKPPYGQVCAPSCRPYYTSYADPCKTKEYCSNGCTWYGCERTFAEACCNTCTYNGDTDCVGCQDVEDCTFSPGG